MRQKKKYESGAATSYITRNQALKKLQLSLADFRRLCILKGIYPHEPRNKRKVGKGNALPKTYFLLKDIQYLLHEPIVNKFRDFKVFLRRLRKAHTKNEPDKVKSLNSHRPRYKLDHIVRERYPTFIDALRDIDDCLCMCFLFAMFPKSVKTNVELVRQCRKLSLEFLQYIIVSKSLRKVFVSIKGIYLQAEVQGQIVTWVIPHKFGYDNPTDVDFKIMSTFVEFYITLIGFVNFRLYHSVNMHYPPIVDTVNDASDENCGSTKADRIEERLASMTESLKKIAESKDVEDDAEVDDFPSELTGDSEAVEQAKAEQESLKNLQTLFSGMKVFLNREVPREICAFIVRAFGGEVSWQTTIAAGASFKEEDEAITHQIVDRPEVANKSLSRYYVQPQWLFDCVNARKLLPMKNYFPGSPLPPHLSPFVEEGENDYVPPEKLSQNRLPEDADDADDADDVLDQEDGSDAEMQDDEEIPDSDEESDDENTNQNDEESEIEEEEDKVPVKKLGKRKTPDIGTPTPEKKKKVMNVEKGKAARSPVKESEKEREERRLAEMMILKKHKNLYSKIKFGKKRKAREVQTLKDKRATIDAEKNKKKRKSAG